MGITSFNLFLSFGMINIIFMSIYWILNIYVCIYLSNIKQFSSSEFLELTFLGPKHLQNSVELLKSLQFIIYFNSQMLSFFHFFLNFISIKMCMCTYMFSQIEFFQVYLVWKKSQWHFNWNYLKFTW